MNRSIGPQPDDLTIAAGLCREALAPALGADWSVAAGDLEWTCRETLEHIANALLFYATHLAFRATERLRVSRTCDPDMSLAELLAITEARTAILREVVVAAPPKVRGFHTQGMADSQGFVAMGCDEILIHTHDIAGGLGLPFQPPEALCRRVAERLFPWAPADVESWPALLWVNGRAALPGRGRLGGEWGWCCIPLEEWDGTMRKRIIPAPRHPQLR